MFEALKLKLEETSFFAGQLAAYTRHPKIFLFHLSAFLTSARAVTLHLQAQFDVAKKEPYISLREELLTDETAKFLLDTRNRVAHKGYPSLAIAQIVLEKAPETGEIVHTMLASRPLEGAKGLAELEEMQRHDWDDRGNFHPPIQIEYAWLFADLPGGDQEVGEVCRAFADRLWHFVYRFRDAWEREHDKGASWRRANAFIDRFLGPLGDESALGDAAP